MVRKPFASTLGLTLAVLSATTGAFAARPPVNVAPTVTAFDVAEDSASPVPVLTFTAADPEGPVTGYLITESSTKPNADAPGWTAAAPSAYTTASTGTVTLWAWAKDNANVVSTALVTDTVVIPALPTNKYANVAIVAARGGDYSDPLSAVSSVSQWCGVPSSTNPCLIKIMPGVYNIGDQTIQLPSFVDIEGSGETATLITGTGNANGISMGASELRSLTVEKTSLTDVHITIFKHGGSAKLTDVTIRSNGIYGLALVADDAGVIMKDVTVDVHDSLQGNGLHIYSDSPDALPVDLDGVDILVNGVGNAAGLVVGGPYVTVFRNGKIHGAMWHAIEAYGEIIVRNSDLRGAFVGVAAYQKSVIVNSRIEAEAISVDCINSVEKCAVSFTELVGPVNGTTCFNAHDENLNPVICP